MSDYPNIMGRNISSPNDVINVLSVEFQIIFIKFIIQL